MPSKPHKTANRPLDSGDVRSILRHLRNGESVSDCARIHNCDRKTIRRVRDGGPTCRNTRKPKKQSATVAKRRKSVASLAKATRKVNGQSRKTHPTCLSIARELRVSKSTVRRDMIALGYVNRVRPIKPKLSDSDYERRLAFSSETLRTASRKDLESVAFSDEKLFDTNDHGLRTEWVRKGEAPQPRIFEKWSQKVMVWGIIAVNYRHLYFFNAGESVDAAAYQKAIASSLKVVQRRKLIFMQDGARCHTAASTMAVLEAAKVEVLQDFPPRSPDLNPIENMWSLVDRLVIDFYEGDLRAAVKKAWDSIPTQTVNNLVLSYKSRLQKVVALEGKFSQ